MSFFVFAGQNYYPLGGADDYRGVYETQLEAELSASQQKWCGGPRVSDWAHVFDSVQGETVARFEYGQKVDK